MPTAPRTAKKLLTADEFWVFVHRSENQDRDFELIHGEVVEVPRPTQPHGRVCFRVGFLLELYAERVGRGYVVGNDSGVVRGRKSETVVGPDVAYFVDAQKFEDLHPKWTDIAPVLVVEVLSPSDEPSEVNEKIELYLKGGVKVLWLVDYARRKVTIYRSDNTLTVVKEDGELTGADDLPGGWRSKFPIHSDCRAIELRRLHPNLRRLRKLTACFVLRFAV